MKAKQSTILLLALASATAHAAPPWVFSFTGTLTDVDGTLVADGSYDLALSIYDAETGGTAIWTEDNTVDTVDGVFDITLGLNSPIDPQVYVDHTDLWLEIAVSGSALVPRLAIASVPWALSANRATTADTLSSFEAFGSCGVGEVVTGIDSTTGAVLCTEDATGSLIETDPTVNSIAKATGLDSCAADEIPKWSGSDWVCAPDVDSGGTIREIDTGVGLTGGPITSSGTLALDTTFIDSEYVNEGQDDSITTGMIVDGTVAAADLGFVYDSTADTIADDGTITSVEISANTITADDIATDAIGSSEIASGAVGTSEILDSSVLGSDISLDTILEMNIATGAVTTDEILNATITSTDIATDTIVAGDIANSAVTTSEILDSTITTSDIAADTIAAADIAADAIGSSEIAAGAVGTSEIADSSVSSSDIATDTIVAGDIATSAVTTSEILDSTITTSDIAADTIAAADIAADAIGSSEIAANAVGAGEIADNAVTASKLGDDLRVSFAAEREVSTISVPSGSTTTIVYNLELYDMGADYSPSTGVFTVPYEGLYHFDACVSYSSAIWTTTSSYITLEVNLTPRRSANNGPTNTGSTSILNAVCISADLGLDDGETVKVTVLQSSGSTKTVSTSSEYTFFNGHRVY